jgi:hypothetical protein
MDADRVPVMSRFYPYFRDYGFTNKPMQKKWKVVELSNEYMQVLILPKIAGEGVHTNARNLDALQVIACVLLIVESPAKR